MADLMVVEGAPVAGASAISDSTRTLGGNAGASPTTLRPVARRLDRALHLMALVQALELTLAELKSEVRGELHEARIGMLSDGAVR